jgi:hypothetical protein
MWSFRRWALQKIYTLDEYTNMQVELFIQGVQTFAGKRDDNPILPA